MSDVHDRLDIPDGAVITSEVEIVGYMRPEDGSGAYALRVNHDAPYSSCLGLIEMAKLDLITEAREQGA